MPIKDRPGFNSRSPKEVRAAAQELALTALSFLAKDVERIGGFLAATGMGPADLRAAASQPEFGAGVLGFILSDEPMLLAFCADAGFRPEDVIRAHAVLDPPFDPDSPVRRG